MPGFMNFEMLGRPEPLRTILPSTGKRSVRFWQMTSNVCVKVILPKVGFLACPTDKWPLVINEYQSPSEMYRHTKPI